MSEDKIDFALLKEEHDKMAVVDNLVWEIAKVMFPDSYIDPKKVEKAKNLLLENLTKE